MQYAAYVGNVEALGFLLERGADCDAARSCEQLAGMQGHDAAVKFLGRRVAQAAKRAKRQARKRANKGQRRQAAAEEGAADEQPPGAAGGGGAEEGAAAAAGTTWGQIRALYAANNPTKLAGIEEIMAKYDSKAKEEALLRALQEKYGAEL